MELENITSIINMGGIGIVLVGTTSMIYLNYKLNQSIKRIIDDTKIVKDNTTSFLDVITPYLVPRISNSQEVEGFRKLAKIRREYNI